MSSYIIIEVPVFILWISPQENVCTGGLGPTPDDLTTETLAACFGVPLEERPEVLADLEAKLRARGRSLGVSNRKQALLPQGAEVLPNPTGTAPGIIWTPQPGFTVLTFPGVPSEMRAMWQQTAVPWSSRKRWRELSPRNGGGTEQDFFLFKIWSKRLRFRNLKI